MIARANGSAVVGVMRRRHAAVSNDTSDSPAPEFRRGACALNATRRYFAPVVALFGFGEQFRFCALASF